MDFNQYVENDALVIRDLRVNVGELVNFLQNRTHIIKLSLVGCNIDTEGVKALARLTNLTKLHLGRNQLSISMDIEGVRALAGLTNLTELDLSGNQLTNIDVIALVNLTNLTKLHLKNNKIGAEGVKALARLTNLTELDLSGNQMSSKDAIAFANLTNLTKLRLQNNSIHAKGAMALANLTNLTELYLRDNKIGKGAIALASLTNLTELDLDYNNIGSRGVEALANLTNLTKLYLDHNFIGNDGIEALVNLPCFGQLKELSLRGNYIRPNGIEVLAKSLYLNGRTKETENEVELYANDDNKCFCDSLMEAYSKNRSVDSLSVDSVKEMIFSVAPYDNNDGRIVKYVLTQYPVLINSRDTQGHALSHFYDTEVQIYLFKQGLIPPEELKIGEEPPMKKPRTAGCSSREERSDEEREVVITKENITMFVEALANELIQYAKDDPEFKKALVNVFIKDKPIDCKEPEKITLEQQGILMKINQELCNKGITKYLPKIDEYEIIINELCEVGKVQSFVKSSLDETQSLQEVGGQFSDASTEHVLEQKQNQLY